MSPPNNRIQGAQHPEAWQEQQPPAPENRSTIMRGLLSLRRIRNEVRELFSRERRYAAQVDVLEREQPLQVPRPPVPESQLPQLLPPSEGQASTSLSIAAEQRPSTPPPQAIPVSTISAQPSLSSIREQIGPEGKSMEQKIAKFTGDVALYLAYIWSVSNSGARVTDGINDVIDNKLGLLLKDIYDSPTTKVRPNRDLISFLENPEHICPFTKKTYQELSRENQHVLILQTSNKPPVIYSAEEFFKKFRDDPKYISTISDDLDKISWIIPYNEAQLEKLKGTLPEYTLSQTWATEIKKQIYDLDSTSMTKPEKLHGNELTSFSPVYLHANQAIIDTIKDETNNLQDTLKKFMDERDAIMLTFLFYIVLRSLRQSDRKYQGKIKNLFNHFIENNIQGIYERSPKKFRPDDNQMQNLQNPQNVCPITQESYSEMENNNNPVIILKHGNQLTPCNAESFLKYQIIHTNNFPSQAQNNFTLRDIMTQGDIDPENIYFIQQNINTQ